MKSAKGFQKHRENLRKECVLPSLETVSKAVPSGWPQENDITLQNMSLTYTSRSTPVMDNITLHVGIDERAGNRWQDWLWEIHADLFRRSLG